MTEENYLETVIQQELSRFDEEFEPDDARRPGVDCLDDGDYDFEIVAAALDRTTLKQELILKMNLKILKGKAAAVGNVVEHGYPLGTSKGCNRLGSDLATLGFDTDLWKAPERPFSVELLKAIPAIKGRCFKGHKQANPGTDREGQPKTFHNLYINGRIPSPTSNGAPVSAPAPVVYPDASQQMEDDSDIPF